MTGALEDLRALPRPDRRAVLLLTTAQALIWFDGAVLLIALPPIARAFRLSPSHAQWVITAYTLAFGVCLLPGGAFADAFGRRRAFVGGAVAFLAASLVAGTAPSGTILVIARAGQGASGAILSPAALGMLTARFAAGAPRDKVLAINGAAAGSGFVGGLVLGGVLTAVFGWRGVMLVNVPVALVIIASAFWILPSTTPAIRRPRLNAVSPALAALAVLLLLIGADAGASSGDASTACALIGGSAAAAALLALVDARSRAPLFPRPFIANSPARSSVAVILTTTAANAGSFAVFGLYLQAGLEYGATEAAGVLAASGVASVAAGSQAARVIARHSPTRLVLGSLALQAAATLAVMLVTPAPLNVLVGEVPIDIGYALLFVTCSGIVMAAAPPPAQARMAALFTAGAQVGAALGVAVLLDVGGAGVARVGRHVLSFDHGALRAGLVGALVAYAAAAFLATKLSAGASATRGRGGT